MSNAYQLVVFDWEGTIADTLGLILHTVSNEANRLGFGLIEPEKARSYVGLGLNQALRKLYPDLSVGQYEELVHAVQHTMASRSIEVCLVPGVREVIQAMYDAHIDLAIASNKGQHSLQRALLSTGLDSFFPVTRCAGQLPAKPCPQMLEEIIEHYGHSPDKTLMIGDSPTDMEMAKSIGVAALGVDIYHQNNAALKAAGAMDVFDSYQKVARFLKIS